MKRVIIVIMFSVFMMFLSCDKQLIFVSCADCTTDEPVETTLMVKLDINSNTMVPGFIKIYEGNIEDSILLGNFDTIEDIWLHNVSVNKQYTVTATYKIGEAIYIAIDSATPKVRYEAEKCDNPCYYVYDRTLNLRIKYTK